METPFENVPSEIVLIAGRGVYPVLLAKSAAKQGVRRIFAIAFKRETNPVLAKHVAEIRWINMGQLQKALDAVNESGIRDAVMAGQIAPRHLFSMLPDEKLLSVLRRLKTKNAETIFGACAEELNAIGVKLMPAHTFMKSEMPSAGILGKRAPTESEQNDIITGIKTAKATSGLDIGQTVVVKNGVILAVEAFEGTDKTILRAGKLGGKGAVVVKVAKQNHDMRFDIPVIGARTFKMLKKSGASALAVEAGKTILLEREKLVASADKLNIAFVAQDTGEYER